MSLPTWVRLSSLPKTVGRAFLPAKTVRVPTPAIHWQTEMSAPNFSNHGR